MSLRTGLATSIGCCIGECYDDDIGDALEIASRPDREMIDAASYSDQVLAKHGITTYKPKALQKRRSTSSSKMLTAIIKQLNKPWIKSINS